MKTLLAAVITATLLALPSVGNAAWVHDLDGNTVQPYSGWAATSYAPAPNTPVNVINHPLPTVFDENGAPHPGTPLMEFCVPNLGCSSPGCPTPKCTGPSIFEYDDVVPANLRRGVFLHELGHVFDFTMMTDQSRATFMRIAGIKNRAWQDTSSPDSPREVFAEAYKLCALWGSKLYTQRKAIMHDFVAYNWIPVPRVHKQACRLIYRVGIGN